ncbi:MULTISPECIES: ArsR/SmtB family transcription factor [Methanoculleus]|uniref:Transcriptional regulator, ArsR family n=2 Tax=Methanoculleus TaxID=45989 RepID=A3CVP1_METMJ|nr:MULTISPECIES: helix-turn-helix domain-containing protein [Methanoculleus]ABN57441.1 transcriptional regulator, ArsR family [Methanoculleus marisnigri JR1]MCC7556072.1 helix-turn-helix domain-containing protein [Methanoculleus marisnigri]UYU18846.1 helix-turn-helix domain-containing protein [Methanoculleus submarinus]
MANDVVVIQPGDEKAQRIARAMASQTANAIIQAFGGGPLTSSEVARRMKIPITTASYHIENLLDAGLLEVMETRWSEKGREVKVYGLANQVLIIASPASDLRSVLQKYATLFGIVALASLGLWSILPAVLPFGGYTPVSRSMTENGDKYAGGTGEDVSTLQSPVPAVDAAGTLPVHDLVMSFFFGACAVLLALLAYEVYYWWRTSPRYRVEEEQE